MFSVLLCSDVGVWPRTLLLALFLKSILSLIRFGMVEACVEPMSEEKKEISKWCDEEPADSSQ